MRVAFEGTLPDQRVHIVTEGEVEEQWIGNQSMMVAVNSDGDIQTGGGGEGVDGIDIFVAAGFEYGLRNNIYVNWDFPRAISTSPWATPPGENRWTWGRGRRRSRSTRRGVYSITV